MLVHKISILTAIIFIAVQVVSAGGPGVSWSKESLLVGEGKAGCLDYGIYNPWPGDVYVQIEASKELQEVLTQQDTETINIPEHTGSKESIPVEFCFKVPKKIYSKDCWLGDFFVCERECVEEQKIYEGDIIVKSVAPPEGVPGGSVATMAVAAPMKVRVECRPFPRNYTMLYVLIGAVSAVMAALLFRKKYGKSKEERLKDRMKSLKAEMKSIKNKK